MSTRRFHKAGNQFVVDRIIELNARTSSTVSSIVNSVTAKSTSKNLTSLQSSLESLVDDGVITSSEKTGLKREWQSLLSSYLSVSADIVLYDDLAELDLVTEMAETYATLAALMDAILEDMSTDYSGEGVEDLTELFITLWEQITEAQQLVNAEVAEANWAQYHTIRVSGDYSGGKLSTSLEAYISYEGEELTDSEYLSGYTWTRLDDFSDDDNEDTWDNLDHAVKGITILNTMLPVDGTRFQITWTDKEDEDDDDYHLLATIIEIPWGTLAKYTWCTATSVSELLEMEEAGEFSWVWGEGGYDSQPDDDTLRLWRAQSTDNGSSWTYYIANGVKGEDGENPIFQYKWSHSFYDPEDWHTVLTFGTDVVTVALDDNTSIVFILQNDDSEWFDYVPDEPDDRPCLWGRCWNFQTEVWDVYRLTGNPGTEPKTVTIGLDTHAVPLDEHGLTEPGITVTATCKMTGITPYTEPVWYMSDGLEDFLSSYSSSVLTEDDDGYDSEAVTSVLVMEIAEGVEFTSGYVYCRVTDTETQLNQGTTSAGSTYQSIQAKFHGVQEGSDAKMVTVGASPSNFLLDEYGMTESQEITFEARLINLNGENIDGTETSGSWVYSPVDTGYISWAEDGLTLTATIAAGLSLSSIYAYYTYVEDGVTYTSYTCQLTGSKDGASAKGLTFELSQAVVNLTSAGVTESSTAITATATLQNISGTVYWVYSSELSSLLSSAPSSGEEIELVFAQGVTFASGYLYCYVDDTSTESLTRYTSSYKSIVGVCDGASAKSYTLTASSYCYRIDQDGLTLGDEIELVCSLQNIDISTVSWKMSTGLSSYASLGEESVTVSGGVTEYAVTLTFASGKSVSATFYVYAVITDTDGNTYSTGKCSFAPVKDGADASRLLLEAESSTYVLTSRLQTPIDESQTLKVTATVCNLSGGSLSWSVEGYSYDDDGTTTLEPYDFQGLGDTLSYTESSSDGYILITVPRGWLQLEYIEVACEYIGSDSSSLATAEAVMSGVATGAADPIYLGAYEQGSDDYTTEETRLTYLATNVSKTDIGKLIYGDHALVNGCAFYINSELAWELAGEDTPSDIYYIILSDCLADAVATPDYDTVSVTQLWAQSLATYNAFIEQLTTYSLRVGSGSTSSGFMARITDYEDGSKLATPLFDVWYGGTCIFKIAPSSGRIFLGEPDWDSLDDNDEPDQPASGFMYSPSDAGGTIVSTGGNIEIAADGTLTCKDALMENGTFTGTFAQSSTEDGSVFLLITPPTGQTETTEWSVSVTSTTYTQARTAYSALAGYVSTTLYTYGILTVEGVETEVWAQISSSLSYHVSATFQYNGNDGNDSGASGTATGYSVCFYSYDSSGNSYTAISPSSLFSVKTVNYASRSSSKYLSSSASVTGTLPTGLYYLTWDYGYLGCYSNTSWTFSGTGKTGGLQIYFSGLPTSTEEFTEDDEGRVYESSENFLKVFHYTG